MYLMIYIEFYSVFPANNTYNRIKLMYNRNMWKVPHLPVHYMPGLGAQTKQKVPAKVCL